jgi:flagellar hook-length control protein FliK
MVALSPVSGQTSALAVRRGAPRSDSDSDFAQALAARADDDDAGTPPATRQRQDHAGSGKTLPDATADPAAPAALDPRLLWLTATPVPVPTPLTAGIINPAAVTVPIVAAPMAGMLSAPDEAGPAPGEVATGKTADRIATGDGALLTQLTGLLHAADHAAAPHGTITLAPATAPPPPVQPATQTISTELAALGLDPTAREDRKKIAADPVVQPMTLTTEVALRNVVQPTGEAQHVPLDLRGDTGLQKMIDHIETLRDEADANDTRIRLVPDALGTVDVAVRREGDAVHVHFAAENAATRTLLTEAQPRLAELAEQRGVRIGGTSVDAGSGGGNHQQPQRQPQTVATNILPTTNTIDATGDDARLA